jgi:hypothetical protein
MPQTAMCIRVPVLTGYARVGHRVVSLPFVRELLEDPRYFVPQDDKPAPRPPGGARLRGRPRGPSVNTIVAGLVCERRQSLRVSA